MHRFLILFVILLGISLALMAAMMAQYGYSLFAPEMRMMLLVAFLVAGYVAFRISQIIARRKQDLSDTQAPGGAGRAKLSGLFAPKSKALSEREARVAARRKQLIAEGKLEEEASFEPEVPPTPEGEAPTRVPQSASVAERMAARRERYKRAKEEGKI